MSTSDSIVSSQTKQSSWRKSDTTWTLGSDESPNDFYQNH
ncbi:L-threonine/L-serine transporter [Escherichia coli]|nr:L-threonine/L-serine transporter [Escherichia coli]